MPGGKPASELGIGNSKQHSIEEGKLQDFLWNIADYKELEALFVDARIECNALEMLLQLKKLRFLGLYFVECDDFPEQVADLKDLRKLEITLEGHQPPFPEAIFGLHDLDYLSIQDYALRSIPVGMTQMVNLRVLALTESGVNHIPDEVITMPSLKELYLPLNDSAKVIQARFMKLNPALKVYIN